LCNVVVEDIDHALFGVENSTEVAAKVCFIQVHCGSVGDCTYVHALYA